jgi:hypothetical protein
MVHVFQIRDIHYNLAILCQLQQLAALLLVLLLLILGYMLAGLVLVEMLSRLEVFLVLLFEVGLGLIHFLSVEVGPLLIHVITFSPSQARSIVIPIS